MARGEERKAGAARSCPIRREHRTRGSAVREVEDAERERQRRVDEEYQHARDARDAKRAEKVARREALAAAAVANPSRRYSTYKSARVLIIGAGPAGLSAAYRLSRDGYEDVRIIDARDRIGGRVHTMNIRELVKRRIDHLQRTQRQRGEERKDAEDPTDPAEAEEELGRLLQLHQCSALGVVDEGAAFVHGFSRANPVFPHFAPSAVRPKSEFHEEWRKNGRRVRSAVVARARRIYSYVDERVLEEVEARPDGEEDRTVEECFDEALDALWERKREKWEREARGEPYAEEEEDDSYKRRVPETQRLEDDHIDDDEKRPTASAHPSFQQRLEDMALQQDILRGLRVSQHCYVAPGHLLSSLDLQQCSKDPPLVDPEVIPLRGYGALITEVWRKTVAQGGVAHPLLGVTAVKVEEKGELPRRRLPYDKSDEQSTSSYVEATVLLKDGKTDSLIADYCIVTVPVGVLKAGQLSFSPPLSSVHPVGKVDVSRQECVDKLAMGCENKVILCWAQPWWPSDDAVQYFRSASHPFVKVIKLAALTTSAHTLVVHFAPPQSSAIERMTDAAATDEALSILREMFGAKSVPRCDFAHVTRWGSDQWSLGSYSYVPVGSSSAYSVWLSEPSYESRLLFAGEHCAGRDMQTVHGAYRCGEEAAMNVKRLVEHHGAREVEYRNERRRREAEKASQQRALNSHQVKAKAVPNKPSDKEDPPRSLSPATVVQTLVDERTDGLSAAPSFEQPAVVNCRRTEGSAPTVSMSRSEAGDVSLATHFDMARKEAVDVCAWPSRPSDGAAVTHSPGGSEIRRPTFAASRQPPQAAVVTSREAPSGSALPFLSSAAQPMSSLVAERHEEKESSTNEPLVPSPTFLALCRTPVTHAAPFPVVLSSLRGRSDSPSPRSPLPPTPLPAPPSAAVSLRSPWLVDMDKQMDEAEDTGRSRRRGDARAASWNTERNPITRSR